MPGSIGNQNSVGNRGAPGEEHFNSKLTDEIVIKAIQLHEDGFCTNCIKLILELEHVCNLTLNRAIRGDTWKHIIGRKKDDDSNRCQ